MQIPPYNLYINFEQLSTTFDVGVTPQEHILRCGLASLEVTTNLLGHSIKERSTQSPTIVSDLLKGIETQLKLLSAYRWDDGLRYFPQTHSKNIAYLKLVDVDYLGQIDQITTLYFNISGATRLGFEDQMNAIRTHFNLPAIPLSPLTSLVDPIAPVTIASLQLDELDYFNIEDKLFMTVHQISEYWFNIILIELECIHKAFVESPPLPLAASFDTVCNALLYLAEHILLLEHMVIADYHPLRVALRGASGGQSHQAYAMFALAKKTYQAFLTLLNKQEQRLVEVLEKPKEYPDSIQIVNYFSKLERGLKNFFFQHYTLSSSIIGSQSFGSIGYDLVSLVDKFVQPIFPEIDQAKYDLTLKTNFQYGTVAGKLIMNKEAAFPVHQQGVHVDTTLIDQVVAEYFDAISVLDGKRWVDLFDPNGYIEDPVGSRPYLGPAQLAIFFKGVVRFFTKLEMTMVDKVIHPDHTAVTWKAKAVTYNDKTIFFNGKEVFEISPEGKILTARVYWNPAIIADQL